MKVVKLTCSSTFFLRNYCLIQVLYDCTLEVDLSLENSTTAGPSSRARRDGVVDFTKDMDPLIINVVKAARFLDETDQVSPKRWVEQYATII